jgi:hypothetical protein
MNVEKEALNNEEKQIQKEKFPIRAKKRLYKKTKIYLRNSLANLVLSSFFLRMEYGLK